MSVIRVLIILCEVLFGVLFVGLAYILTEDFLGFGPSKIYSDSKTFWLTSLPPIGALLISGFIAFYLHKKQMSLVKREK